MVSVIIPTYARPDKVIFAIESVRKQTLNDIEIIVVDDNGENTAEQKETERTIKRIKDSRIHYIAHRVNAGGCAARNTGIIQAKGEFVAFLDDDDRWAPTFLEEMLPEFRNETTGAVYCDFYTFNGTYTYTHKKSRSVSGNVFHELLRGKCPTSTSLFIIRKSCFELSGMFDPKVKSFQDYDMWLRLSQHCDFSYVPKKLVLKYEGFGEQTSKNPEKRMAGYKYITEKYNRILSANEKQLFSEFEEKFYFDTLYRRIVYNKEHGLQYKEDLNEYLNKHGSSIHRIHMFLRLYMPKSLYNWMGMLALKRNRNMIVIKGEIRM